MLLEGKNRQNKLEMVYIEDLVPQDYTSTLKEIILNM